MCSSEKQSWENASVLTGIIQALRIKKKFQKVSSFHPKCTILEYQSNSGNCNIVDLSFFSSRHQDPTKISFQTRYWIKWV